ncbi:hypothetical protein [Aliikangiella maris]|uniref:Uncharacterized protein n=2 Tax=Aliikangiella maris TaxID=3162458 RepID=A0ABV3MR87_9GAMM
MRLRINSGNNGNDEVKGVNLDGQFRRAKYNYLLKDYHYLENSYVSKPMQNPLISQRDRKIKRSRQFESALGISRLVVSICFIFGFLLLWVA